MKTEEKKILASSVCRGTRVTYRDTDRMGHVYYANYLVWMEIGRTDLLRNYGKTYRQWEDEDRIFIPVSSCWIDYKSPAQYDDLLEIRTTVTHITRASITFEYEIVRAEDGVLLARGGTTHPFIDETGRIKRVGDRIMPELFPRE